jgi:hypothetical protein
VGVLGVAFGERLHYRGFPDPGFTPYQGRSSLTAASRLEQ